MMKKLLFIFLMSAITNNAHAQYGEADPSIPELSQFEYMRGLWEVTMFMAQEDGSFEELANKATVRAFYHEDGRSFQSIFSTTAGGFTTDIRTYNIEEKKWQILFMNARAQRWHKFEAQIVDGNMQTFVEGGYSGLEPHDIKIIDQEISGNSFTKHVFRRMEGEDEWKNTYIMQYKKKPAT